MQMIDLPDDLGAHLPAVALQGDPDGEIERAIFAVLETDVVAAARLALTIQNPCRRAVFLRNFRASTLAAARQT